MVSLNRWWSNNNKHAIESDTLSMDFLSVVVVEVVGHYGVVALARSHGVFVLSVHAPIHWESF